MYCELHSYIWTCLKYVFHYLSSLSRCSNYFGFGFVTNLVAGPTQLLFADPNDPFSKIRCLLFFKVSPNGVAVPVQHLHEWNHLYSAKIIITFEDESKHVLEYLNYRFRNDVITITNQWILHVVTCSCGIILYSCQKSVKRKHIV